MPCFTYFLFCFDRIVLSCSPVWDKLLNLRVNCYTSWPLHPQTIIAHTQSARLHFTLNLLDNTAVHQMFELSPWNDPIDQGFNSVSM